MFKVYSWGFNQNAQLGHGHFETLTVPTLIKKGLENVDIKQVPNSSQPHHGS